MNFLEILFVSSFTTSSARFREFDSQNVIKKTNVILFQIKVFDRNIKEATVARFFIKVTALPIFTGLGVMSLDEQIEFIIYQNGKHF